MHLVDNANDSVIDWDKPRVKGQGRFAPAFVTNQLLGAGLPGGVGADKGLTSRLKGLVQRLDDEQGHAGHTLNAHARRHRSNHATEQHVITSLP
jgi:hypothetical protein